MTSRQSKLQEDTDFRIMRLLQDNPKLTQRELAKALGISLGGVNYCLQALLNKGMVKLHNFQNNRNKLVYAYLLTPDGIAEKASLTTRFLKRKMEEYESLKAEIEAIQREVTAVAEVSENSEANKSTPQNNPVLTLNAALALPEACAQGCNQQA